MSDFNMVNVQSQSQIGKSVDTTKLRMLALDVKDFTAFLPILKELQTTSSKILKQLNPILSKKDKKTISLPYNLLKKFQTLKDNLVQSEKVLEFQGRVYSCSVGNRDYEKVHDQQFFRRTLKSYDEKRLWMKQYILNNEATVQNVEEEVKRNIDYETHKFTEFRRELNVERLQHNYEEKLDLFDKNVQLLHINNRTRDRIKAKIAAIEKQKKLRQQHHISVEDKPADVGQGPVTNTKMLKVPSFTPFLLLCFAKNTLRNQFLAQSVLGLKKRSSSLTHSNQQLKLAIDKIHQQIELDTLQVSISLYQTVDLNEQTAKTIPKNYKITKTDFFLYQKQLHRHCKQILSIYGNYFQYALNSQAFPNHLRSKSAAKYYPAKIISDSTQDYADRLIFSGFKQYANKDKSRIYQQKKVRQERRKEVTESNKILMQMKNSRVRQSQQMIKQHSIILQKEEPQQLKPDYNAMQREKHEQVTNKENKNEIELQQQEFGQI